jgi:methionyl-tRNA formyltransferase
MNILLVGEDAPGIQLLRALPPRGHVILGVVAREDPPSARGATMWAAATKEGIPTWPAERMTDPTFANVFRHANVDLLLNVYSLFIIDEHVLRIPRLGAYNVHPGPLPAYAGLNSACWAILHGEREHGVTVHRMEPEVDTGPIAYHTEFPIEPTDTGLSLSSRCIREGIGLMMRLVDQADRDPSAIPAIPQDLSRRSYFDGRVPYGGRLAWTLPARKIRDFVRACRFHPFPSPWGTPTAVLAGREFGIAAVSSTGDAVEGDAPGSLRRSRDGSMLVASADEWIRLDAVIERGRLRTATEALGVVGPTEDRPRIEESRRGESNP